MKNKIEQAVALIRQGQPQKALVVLARVLQDLPDTPVVDTTEDVTLELAIPMEFPTVELHPLEDGGVDIVIDAENNWKMGRDAEYGLHVLCSSIKDRNFFEGDSLNVSDLNVYKMSIAAKLKEMVLAEQIFKK